MSLSRFHLPASDWDSLALTDDEAQHCGRVLRKAPGDRIEVFDGAGRVAIAIITAITKSKVQVRLESEHRHEPLAHAIHLLPAMIKAEPFEWLLEKAVELGAASVQPIITDHTIVHLVGDNLEKKLAKWRRHMVESAKQCHTPFIPVLEAPRSFATLIPALPSEAVKILPALSEHSRSLDRAVGHQRTAYIAIGPEGDFTSAEEAFAQQHGFVPVTLGPLILRAETAAITALAVLSHELRRAGASKSA